MKGYRELFVQSMCDDRHMLLLPSLFHSLKKVYLVENGPFFYRDEVLDAAKTAHLPVEQLTLVIDPIDSDVLQGIIVESKGIALLDEEVFGQSIKKICHDIENVSVIETSLSQSKHIRHFMSEREKAIGLAQRKFLIARSHLDRVKAINRQALMKTQVSALLNELLEELFADVPLRQEDDVVFDQGYFGANTCRGHSQPYRLFDQRVERFLILKGGVGIGKSRLLEALSTSALASNQSVYLYRCPFYPDGLDGLVIPSLKTAIVDGAEPHLVEPYHPCDKMYLMNERCLDPRIIYSHAPELKEATAKYKQYMRQATLYLKEAKNMHDNASFFVNTHSNGWIKEWLTDRLRGGQ